MRFLILFFVYQATQDRCSASPWRIGPRLLREQADRLDPALTTEYNSTMESGEVLTDYRGAKVMPILQGSILAPGSAVVSDFRKRYTVLVHCNVKYGASKVLK